MKEQTTKRKKKKKITTLFFPIAAVLSVKIQALEQHCKQFKQDKRAQRDLKAFRDHRRRIFKTLRDQRPQQYFRILKEFRLADEVPPQIKRRLPAALRVDDINTDMTTLRLPSTRSTKQQQTA
jgi:ribosomal protein S15P/S13E